MIVEQAKNHKPFKQWNCGSCGKRLGLIYPNKTLVIKFKDLMLWVNGECKTICRECQTENNYSGIKKWDDL